MPLVRMIQAVAGPDFSWTPGEIVEMSGPDAEVWADGVRSELVRDDEPETPERNAAAAGGALQTTATTTPAEPAHPSAGSAKRRPSSGRASKPSS